MPGQTFAYLRVPKVDQGMGKNRLATTLQIANDAHLGHVHFVEKKISGFEWKKSGST